VRQADTDTDEFRYGMTLFNQGHFFDAHEVWEDVWRAAPVEAKKFLQGLIQLAVGFHHHSTGNVVGACSLLRRGSRNLRACPDEHCDIEVDRLLDDVSQWLNALENGLPLPSPPCVHKSSG
jgi:uncharacterized protein